MSRSFTILIALLILLFGILMLRGFSTNTKLEDVPSAKVDAPAITTETNLQYWREFKSPNKTFKVLFPSLPQHAADKLPDPKSGEMRKYETYIAADVNGAAFMVSAITYARNVAAESGDESLKAAIMDILSRNRDNKLNDMKPDHYQDIRSLDFSITSNDMSIGGKVFAVGNTIYVLSMINKTSLFNQKELLHFIDSFELLNNSKNVSAPTLEQVTK